MNVSSIFNKINNSTQTSVSSAKNVVDFDKSIFSVKENLKTEDTKSSDCFQNLPDIVGNVLLKADFSKMPDNIKNVISEVNNVFGLAKNLTDKSDTKEREKFEDEKSNVYRDITTLLGGEQAHITYGKQIFDERDNEYVETYKGNSDEGEQTGGFGVLNYLSGEIEIHYDNFVNGAPVCGYGVVIAPEDNVIVYYETDYAQGGESVKQRVYSFEGDLLEE